MWRHLIVAGCIVHGAATGARAESDYSGSPYRGTVSVEIIAPEGHSLVSDRGQAEARFTPAEDGLLDLTVKGTIDQEGDAGFAATLGPTTESGWRTEGAGLDFAIAPDGTIAGANSDSIQDLSFSGRIDGTSMDFQSRVQLNGETPSGHEPGTVFVFTYALTRPGADTGEEAAPIGTTTSGSDCARIGTRTRVIGSPTGIMSTILESYCIPGP